jgi:hypothetical protein
MAGDSGKYLKVQLMLVDFVAQEGDLGLEHLAQERMAHDLGVRRQHYADRL